MTGGREERKVFCEKRQEEAKKKKFVHTIHYVIICVMFIIPGIGSIFSWIERSNTHLILTPLLFIGIGIFLIKKVSHQGKKGKKYLLLENPLLRKYQNVYPTHMIRMSP